MVAQHILVQPGERVYEIKYGLHLQGACVCITGPVSDVTHYWMGIKKTCCTCIAVASFA